MAAILHDRFKVIRTLGGDEFCALMSARLLEDDPRTIQRIEEYVQMQNERLLAVAQIFIGVLPAPPINQ